MAKRKITKQVRIGIVGLGFMGRNHAKAIVEAGDKEFCLAAVADAVGASAKAVGEEYAVPYFTDPQTMYASGLVDAVMIVTPHFWHPVQAILAARAGLHVLCEKPLAVTVGAARAMVQECRKHKVAFGAMLQHRTRGQMIKLKQMVADGAVGDVYRVVMECSSWYRSQAYYDSGAWRGTWDGEGGGILLNQAPHHLDLFQWIAGMPRRVVAVLGTRGHNIEVENTADIICQYDGSPGSSPRGGGKIGYIHATTAQVPGEEKFEVYGDKGALVSQGGVLKYAKLSAPISRHIQECKESRADFIIPPKFAWEVVKVAGDDKPKHIIIIRAFARHILHGTDMVAGGDEAVNQVELTNAMYLSGFGDKIVDLPVDGGEVDRLLAKLQRERSTGKGGGASQAAGRELRKLLRRGK
jgi:predicted dehydrogenase